MTLTDAPRFDARPFNKPATVSMVAGLLLCIPGSGIVAIIFGILGYKRARTIGGAGARQAMVGVVLGVIQTAWGAAIIGGIVQHYRMVQVARPAWEATSQWVMLVGAGNVNAAMGVSRAPIDETMLTDTAEMLRDAGVIKDVKCPVGIAVYDKSNVEIQALIEFDKDAKLLITWWDTSIKEAPPKMIWYKFETPPAKLVTPAPSTQKK